MINYYEILGVSQNAEVDVVSAAYKALMRKYHPDLNTSADAQAKAQIINEAYDVLNSPEKRRQYDDELSNAEFQKSQRDQGRTSSNQSGDGSGEDRAFQEFQAFKMYQDYRDFRRHQKRQYWSDLAKDAASVAKDAASAAKDAAFAAQKNIAANSKQRPREPLNWAAFRSVIIAGAIFLMGALPFWFIYLAYNQASAGAEEANTEPYAVKANEYIAPLDSPDEVGSNVILDDKNIPSKDGGRVHTFGEFFDNIKTSTKIARTTFEVGGVSGAKSYSQSCAIAAEESQDILKTDFCVAFDMLIAVKALENSTESQAYMDPYFQNKVQNFESLYFRFGNIPPNRVEFIWEEVKKYM